MSAPFHLVPGPYAGGAWQILECAPKDSRVSAPDYTAFVPKFQLRQDLLVQQHELAHVARAQCQCAECDALIRQGEPGVAGHTGIDLTWAGWDQYSLGFRLMVEEIAIEAEALAHGPLDIRQARDHFDWGSFPLPDTSKREALAQMMLQLTFSEHVSENAGLRDYYRRVCEAMPEDDIAACARARDSVALDRSAANCDRVTRELAAHFLPPPPPPPGKPKRETPEARQARAEAEAAEAEAEAEAEAAERATPSPNSSVQDVDPSKLCPPGSSNDPMRDILHDVGPTGHPLYGTARIDVHRHTLARQGARCRGSVWRSTDAGGPIRYPGFLLTGRVYGRRARGGSILVDGSGSMGAIGNTLERLIAEFPAIWVGFYSEHANAYHGLVNGAGTTLLPGTTLATHYTARLCIVADNGRLGDANFRGEREHTGGNGGSDPLCLAYMLRQGTARGPYLWVSDGLVGEPFAQDTHKIMRQGGVIRVHTIQDALAYLQGKRVETFSSVASIYGI